MKILPVPLIREADAFTIIHEPIADIDLMERAATACYEWLKENLPKKQKIIVFCGSGNNGGDGLAIARLLGGSGYRVEVFCLAPPDRMSESCRINFERARETIPVGFTDGTALPEISRSDIVVDAIFGSGLTRPPEGNTATLIRHINASDAMVIAIDVPSGLFCDEPVEKPARESVIQADHTLTFSPPKLAFFFPENDAFAGKWHLLNIGISKEFIESAIVRDFMLEAADVASILRKRSKFSHKGTYGHALLIAGSTGKMGAAVLSARACLRSGPGLVTVRVPKSGVTILQSSVPEAMLAIDPEDDHYSEVPDLAAYSAVAIGPGIGISSQTATGLKILIQNSKVPILFDADAINILAENRTWLGFIPKGSVFTPHPGEFERLVGKSTDNFDRNRMQRDFCTKHQCYMVLKGANTAITTPDGQCYFNTTGNPGMATGGSGDVLTGIIAGLMAQGYSSLQACLLGVYIHGLAGDIALEEQGYESLIANDIVVNLGKSFQTLYGKF